MGSKNKNQMRKWLERSHIKSGKLRFGSVMMDDSQTWYRSKNMSQGVQKSTRRCLIGYILKLIYFSKMLFYGVWEMRTENYCGSGQFKSKFGCRKSESQTNHVLDTRKLYVSICKLLPEEKQCKFILNSLKMDKN